MKFSRGYSNRLRVTRRDSKMRPLARRRTPDSKRIRDWAAVIKIERLHTVGVRANDEIYATIDQPTVEFALFVSDFFAVFDSPVNKANDKICV